MKKYTLQAALLIIALIFTSFAANSAVKDNKGKEFVIGFLPNIYEGNVELHLTSDVGTMVTVDYPLNAPTFTTTVAVGPGAVTIVSLPTSATQGWLGSVDAVANNCVHAYSTDDFVCYMINRAAFTSDAGLALPIDVMNTDYIVLTYSAVLFNSTDSEFDVYALYDGTTVTITPSVDMQDGKSAGVPFNVVLNKGEGYYNTGINSGSPGDLSGTMIHSDRPVGMTNGNVCANIPLGVAYCDHIFEVAQPTETWGKYIPLGYLANRTEGSPYKIVASEDNTTVNLDGAFLVLLNKGQYYETSIMPGNHLIDADKPVFVCQFMTGSQNGGTGGLGDPAQSNMIPIEQYLTSYTFSTVGGDQFVDNWVTIVCQNADIGTSMKLDGSLVPAADFSPVPGTTLSAAAELLTSGTHSTTSTSGHAISVYGMNTDDSYEYPGGGLFQFINPVGDANPPLCSLCVKGQIGYGSGWDARPTEDVNGNGSLDGGEDLNGNGQIDVDKGIYDISLDPGSSNLTLNLPPFSLGDGEVDYTVTLTDPSMNGSGLVVVTDGAGNMCRSEVFIPGNAVKPPTVTTSMVNHIGPTTANGGGCVTDDGGSTLTHKGIVWSTTPGPQLVTNENGHTDDIGQGTGIGCFNSMMAGLTPCTVYYVSAYATNSAGTSYGSWVVFMTAPPVNQLALWLNSEFIGQPNNSLVSLWRDASIWGNDAHQPDRNRQPTYLWNQYMGYPAVDFMRNYGIYTALSDEMYVLNSPASINNPQTSKCLFLVFQTSQDVVNTQVLFEAGGFNSGFNVYIERGNINFGVWKSSPGLLKKFLSRPINPNTVYFAYLTLQGGQFYAYLNGSTTNTPFTGLTVDASPNGVGGEYIGTRTATSTYGASYDLFFNGMLYEVMLSNNSDYCWCLYNYLCSKYQLPGCMNNLNRTVDNGAWDITSGEEQPAALSGDGELTQAYPNPFNNTATFSVRVAEQQNVQIELYDAIGNRVATLFSGTLDKDNSYDFTIDGANLTPGLYVYRVKGDRFVESGKVVLTK